MFSLSKENNQLEQFFERFDPLFSRSESRRSMREYIRGLLSDAKRKNTWQIAEKVGLLIPDSLQRLLYRVAWDADEMGRLLRENIMEHFDWTPGVGVIDESGFVKKGNQSAGVARQYCGRVGKVENCQVGVFLGYVVPQGHALLDRELYLPEKWCEDQTRRAEAHIPPEITFKTKPELAQQMLKRAWDEDIPLQWIVADTVYGNSPSFRNFIHEEDRYYVAGISRKMPLMGATSDPLRSAEEHLEQLPEEDWMRCATRAGEKGLIWYDWITLRVIAANDNIGEQWLLVRRNLHNPNDCDYFLANAPEDSLLDTLVMVASARHHIEEALEEGKGQAGLADYQVRFWHSWYRHITLSMAAHTLLTLLRLESVAEEGEKNALRQLDNFQFG